MTAIKPTVATNWIAIQPSGNCNFSYVTHLKSYGPDNMRLALFHIFTNKYQSLNFDWNGNAKPAAPQKPVYQAPAGGMFLFAQGSDDSPRINPYARNLQELIEELGLGQVIKCPGAPNPLHGGNKGVLYVWIIDHTAARTWWTEECKVHYPDAVTPPAITSK